MEQRFEIVEAARGWIGTPYRHQMSQKGAGSDCLGLLRGVWRETMGREPETPPAYSRDWSEPQGTEALWEAAAKHLLVKEIDDEALGDILLFRMRDGSIAKHVGVQTGTGEVPSFVHSYDRHGVIESTLSEPWRRRIVARFRFPERKK